MNAWLHIDFEMLFIAHSSGILNMKLKGIGTAVRKSTKQIGLSEEVRVPVTPHSLVGAYHCRPL